MVKDADEITQILYNVQICGTISIVRCTKGGPWSLSRKMSDNYHSSLYSQQ